MNPGPSPCEASAWCDLNLEYKQVCTRVLLLVTKSEQNRRILFVMWYTSPQFQFLLWFFYYEIEVVHFVAGAMHSINAFRSTF